MLVKLVWLALTGLVPSWHHPFCLSIVFLPTKRRNSQMPPQKRKPERSGFVYLPNGPMKDSPYSIQRTRSRGGNTRGRTDATLADLSSGESAAVEHAIFVNVKAHFQTTGIAVTYEDFVALKTSGKLNDSVLDAFFALLQARNLQKVPRHRPDLPPQQDNDFIPVLPPRVFVFNTYLYTSLVAGGNYNYKRVERWFRKQGGDFEKLDMVMIPINTGLKHWVLVVIDLREESVLYYDPLGGYDSVIVSNCKKWLADEFSSAGYKGSSDPRTWKLDNRAHEYPRQMDSSSCGIFIAFVAEAIERSHFPRFKQSDTDLLRKRALIYLVDGKM